jgi:hypothetical protein
MTKFEIFLEDQKSRLIKALAHLKYSYNKVQHLSAQPAQLNEETLETWESFVARFSRVADIFLTKYLRTAVLLQDPGFIGSFRDFINQAEKLGLIENVERWLAIRELRNISAHEYTDKDLAEFLERLRNECPLLLSIQKIVE